MSKISEFTDKAVREYLRAVVLIDDKAFANQDPITPTSAENGGGTSGYAGLGPMPSQGGAGANVDAGSTAGEQSSESSSSESADRGNSFNPQEVVSGFASEGIVCGLYSPQSMNVPVDVTCNEFKKLERLCANSDVFILDWLLNPNDRESPVPKLLQKLIATSEGGGAPKPIRFCAIYTRENPVGAFSELCNFLDETYPEARQKTDTETLSLQIKGINVVAYGKDVRTAEGHYVPASELATCIIRDFAKSHEGVLPAAALNGIAAIRNNTNRFLDKFPADLDFALMVHAGLTMGNPSVAEDVSVLVSDEMRSIIFDTNPSGANVYSLLAEKMASVEDSVFSELAADTALVRPSTTAESLKAFFVSLFTAGRTSECPLLGCETRESKPSKELLAALLKLVEKTTAAAAYKSCDLSKLFCQRTIYSPERVLRPGTVVRDAKNKYYVCMMPLCDTLRLGAKKAVKFPFWKLTPADAHKSGKAYGIVVTDADGCSQRLCLKGKIRDRLSILSFVPDDVVKFVKSGNRFAIKEKASNAEYEWVAELKPFHAQRMSEHVSREFSRVGLTESEWLRLQVDR